MASSVSATVPLVVQLLASLPAAEQASLIESCSLAHQTGRCIDASEASEQDTLRASIDFTGETRVTLEVTDTDPGRSLYASRELFFEPDDDREERARAIGLALGVLATTLSKGRPPSEELDSPPKAEQPAQPPTTQTLEPEVPTATISDDGKKEGPGSWGVSLSGGVRIVPTWGVAAATGALGILGYPHPNWGGLVRAQLSSFPPGTRNIPMSQISASIGPSFRTISSPYFLSAALTGGVQSTEARLTLADAEVRKGTHVSALTHLEATLGRELVTGVALTFTPTFDVLFSEVDVLLNNQLAGRTGTTQVSFLLGILLMPRP